MKSMGQEDEAHGSRPQEAGTSDTTALLQRWQGVRGVVSTSDAREAHFQSGWQERGLRGWSFGAHSFQSSCIMCRVLLAG